MSKKILGFAAAIFLLLSPVLAQTSAPPPTGSAPAGRMARSQPCWQKAGVSQSAMEQRRAIESDIRSQVSAVCSDSSLSPQQKQKQVQEIHQQGKQKMEGLLTSEQEQTLRACQQQNGGTHDS